MSATALQLTEITKTFRTGKIGRGTAPIVAVDRVTLTLNRGDVFGLLGANGAGKSTLLRIIAGTIRPDSGSQLRNGAVGLLLGNTFGLYDRLSAREYLRYIGRLRGVDPKTLPDRIAQVADEMGLFSFLDRRCGEFSAGMRQRTAIAATIIHRPQLLLLDEPTTGLDIHVRKSVLDAIATLAKNGHSMIISTHHPEEVRAIATRVIVMDRGAVVAHIDESNPAFQEPYGLTAAAHELIPGDDQENEERG